MFKSISGVYRTRWQYRGLLKQLVRREVQGRYRGSLLGLGWSFFMPLLMLAIYTFVFGSVFKARWSPSGPAGPLDFALTLFAGLIVFNFFAEVSTRAPGLITAHPNYVKKVVFPLALLPVATSMAGLFHAGMSLFVLIVALGITGHLSPWALALPLVWLPFTVFVVGLAWILAALGVFLRDIGQLVGPGVSALLFLSPVFYPVSALPETLRTWLFLNPLTVPIEATRAILIDARSPDWHALGWYTGFSLAMALLGWIWFEKTKKGFADVL